MNTFPIKPQRGLAGQLFFSVLAETQQRRGLAVNTGGTENRMIVHFTRVHVAAHIFYFLQSRKLIDYQKQTKHGCPCACKCVRVCQLRVCTFFWHGTDHCVELH